MFVTCSVRPKVGLSPAPVIGAAMLTQTNTAKAQVKFDSIPSVVAETFLYLTNKTVDTRIYVNNASVNRIPTTEGYVGGVLFRLGGTSLKTLFSPSIATEIIIAAKAPQRSMNIIRSATGRFFNHFPSVM